MILSRLKRNQPVLKDTNRHLNLMAGEGFRTLAVAQKDLTSAEYAEWSQDFHAASVAVTNREEKLNRMAEIIETNLTLIGATAVEDKLQVQTHPPPQ